MAVFGILLLTACGYDYCKRRIPNPLVLMIWVFGMYLQIQARGLIGMPFCFIQSVVIMTVFYPLFQIGALGAGDVKLFGAVAGSLPFEKIFIFSFYSLLIAAIISLIKLLCNGQLKNRLLVLIRFVLSVIREGDIFCYPEDEQNTGSGHVCLSGPVMLGWILLIGGIY